MDTILAQLADVGGPAFVLVLIFRFWSQFQDLLTLASRSAGWAVDQLQTFVDRTSVIMARKIWWVILPIQLVMLIASSISAWNIPGNGWWFSANFVAKLLAFVASCAMAYESSRVQHPPDNHGLTSQADVNKKYGRPGLFVPMIMTAFLSLVTMTGAMLSDTFMLADVVWFYHSMFQAILFILMLFLTVSFMAAGLFTAYVFSRLGIDFGAGGLWSSVVVPLATVSIPGLTGRNNEGLKIAPAERTRLNQAAWNLLVDNRLAGGLMMAWVLFFISFHGPIAWVVELGLIIMLMACLFTYVWFIQKPMLRVAEITTVFICAVGAISFLVRLVDAAVLRGPGDHSVMLYRRVGSIFSSLMSEDPERGFNWFYSSAQGFDPTFVFVVIVVAVIAAVLASKVGGVPARLLYLVAIIFGVTGVGLVLARSAYADPAEAPRGEVVATCGAAPCAGPFDLTVNAGTHSPPQATTCSVSDPSRPCP